MYSEKYQLMIFLIIFPISIIYSILILVGLEDYKSNKIFLINILIPILAFIVFGVYLLCLYFSKILISGYTGYLGVLGVFLSFGAYLWIALIMVIVLSLIGSLISIFFLFLFKIKNIIKQYM
jgi:hypothetical protein